MSTNDDTTVTLTPRERFIVLKALWNEDRMIRADNAEHPGATTEALTSIMEHLDQLRAVVVKLGGSPEAFGFGVMELPRE